MSHDSTSASRRPLAIDLFSGAGGMSLGFEQGGFDVVAAVEYDPVHAATHEFNFPLTTVLCADVANVSAKALRDAAHQGLEAHGHDVSAWDGTLDVVFGGPPCQGFSSIGRRLVDDRRNRLVFHFFRLVSELRPRYFVMENVPGMARGGHASILRQLVNEFEEAGYHFAEGGHRVLDAAFLGVPQQRRRLFLLGARDDQPLADYPTPKVQPVPKCGGDSPSPLPGARDQPIGPTVWDAIGDLPNLNRFPRLLRSDEVRLSWEAVAAMEATASPYARRMLGLQRDPEDRSRPRRHDRRLLTSSMRTVHTRKSIQRFRATGAGQTEPISRFYRPDATGLCNTLRAGTGSEGGAFTSPRPIHPTLPRVLSVREAARLHSFPDWFRFHETKWNGFRQIGNAVAPLVARTVAARIVAALEVDPPIPAEPLELGDRAMLSLTMHQAATHFDADRDAMPRARRRDWSRVAERLFLEVHRPGTSQISFKDADIESAFRAVKIRPPHDLGRLAHFLASPDGLSDAVRRHTPDGCVWRAETADEGSYRLIAAGVGGPEAGAAHEEQSRPLAA